MAKEVFSVTIEAHTLFRFKEMIPSQQRSAIIQDFMSGLVDNEYVDQDKSKLEQEYLEAKEAYDIAQKKLTESLAKISEYKAVTKQKQKENLASAEMMLSMGHNIGRNVR